MKARGRKREPSRWRGLSGLVAALALASMVGTTALAAPVRIYAAGSLKAAMQDLIAASGLPETAFAQPVFGPAGLLRERLEKGETADLFASADMTQPNRLAAATKGTLVVPFARNRMCIAFKPSLGLTASNVLDTLLDPKVRLATSTPGNDPGGDYAMAVFDKADGLRAGAGQRLRDKALHLLGAPKAMVTFAGLGPAAAIFRTDMADALLLYCSGIPALLKEVDGLAALPLPEALEVHPTYALAILSDNADAARFGLFILSTAGQRILSRFGFVPLTSSN